MTREQGAKLAKARKEQLAEPAHMTGTDDLVNKGVILRPGASKSIGSDRTFIISGVGRGGTSLVAAVLSNAGLYLGQHLSEAVYEDPEFMGAFQSRNRELLTRLIANRNASHRKWGFKAPFIHAVLQYQDISLFRNPQLIIIFRDPVAIAERASISEYLNPLTYMGDSLDSLRNLIGFVHNTTVPALLLSYEKALLNPSSFIDTLMRFCDIALDEPRRDALLQIVEPNAKGYINVARRQFVGQLDYVLNGILYGWCWEVGSLQPVELDCYVGGRRIATFKAGDFRADLLAAGYANGNHGFALDLRPFNPDPEQQVLVRVTGREFVLSKSERRLSEYERQ